jgi:hypothetical protein
MLQLVGSFEETAELPEVTGHSARIDAPRDPRARTLLAHWRSCIAQSGACVIGRDIPAARIARLLNHVVIAEPLCGVDDMKLRLAGAALRAHGAAARKSALLSDLLPADDFPDHVAAAFEALRTGRPVILKSVRWQGDVERMHSEVVFLAVSPSNGQPDWLLAGIFQVR